MDQSAYEIFMLMAGAHDFILQTAGMLLLGKIFGCPDREHRPVAATGIFIMANFVLWAWTPVYIQYPVLIFIVCGYCRCKYRKYYETAVFVLLLSLNIWSLSSLAANSVYEYAGRRLMEGVDIYSPASVVNGKLAVARILYMFVYTAILLVMTAIIGKEVKSPLVFRWPETVCLSVINIIGAMLRRMTYDLLQVDLEYDIFFLFREQKDWLWKIPVIAVLLFAGEAAAIYSWQKLIELQREKQRHFVEEQQIAAMREKLAEAERFYGSIRRVRHEMKNHMTNIKGLAAGEKYQALESYIDRLDESIGKLEYQFATGNAVMDVILNDKYQRAQRSGISFRAIFSWEAADTVSVFDMGIILSNLLDNAIEACERLEQGERYIDVTLRRKERFLLLEVENSFNGEILFEKGAHLPVTSKKADSRDDMMEHGIGLKNVKNVAERYLGGVNIKVQGHVFRITVMLQQR